jgi:arabinogalactan oligomer / maltooligosaccharide transport system permease protein
MTTMTEAPGGPVKSASSASRTGLLTRVRRSYDRYWYGWAMVLPVVIVMAVLVLYPLFRGFYLSLTNATEANVAKDIGVNHVPATYHTVGLHNYWEALSGHDGQFYPRLIWTVIWTVSCGVFQFLFALVLANMLNRKMRFRLFYRMALILPWAVPGFIGIFAWRLMLNSQFGVLNQMLTHLGLPAQDWLGTPLHQKIAVILVNVWLGIPFQMVALLGGMQSIPAELNEAAEMDGASPWQRFLNVTMPGLRPVSSTVILIGSIWTFNQFAVIYLLLGQNTTGDADILVTYAFNKAFKGVSDYSGAATYGILILLILLVFSTFYRRRELKAEQS